LLDLLQSYVKEFNRSADEENFEIFLDHHIDQNEGLVAIELSAAGVLVTVIGEDDYVIAYMSLAEDDLDTQEQRKIFRMPAGAEAGTFSFQGTDIAINQVSLPAKKIFALFLDQASESHTKNPQPRVPHDDQELDQEKEEESDNDTAASSSDRSSDREDEIRQLNGLLGNFIGAEISEEPHANTGLSNLLVKKEESGEKHSYKPYSRDENEKTGDLDMLETRELSLFDACEMLRRSVSSELESLTREGVRAFERQDMEAVGRTMQKVNKIKALQDRIFDSLDEWQTELSED